MVFRLRNSLVAAAILALTACAADPSKETVGALTGGVTGGIIGSQFGKGTGKLLATGAGAVLGAFIGSEIGKKLDERDRAAAAQAEYDALENGQAGTVHDWRNGSSGHSGSITPGPSYSVNDYTCRDYVDRLLVDGHTETLHGTACRQPDGTWRPLS